MESRATFVIVNCLYLAIVGGMVYAAYQYGGEGSIVSLVIGIPTLAMIVFVLGSALFRGAAPAQPSDPEEQAAAPWSRAAVIAAWLAGFFLLIFLVGFYRSVFVFSAGFLRFEGKTSWSTAVAAAVLLWAVLYLSFDYVMGQELFNGILFKALVPNF